MIPLQFVYFTFVIVVGEPFQSTALASGQDSTILQELSSADKDYRSVAEELQSTIVEHKDGGVAGGIFLRYIYFIITILTLSLVNEACI